jgi:nucleotide-binding universal stress UspA family protein
MSPTRATGAFPPLTPAPTADPHATGQPTALRPGPILVASAGTDEADTALWLAYLLVGRTGADVLVTSVVEPHLAPDPAFGFVRMPPTLRQAQLREREAEIATQLARTSMNDAGWPVEVLGGDPARTIADRARATDAQLIVLGRTRHALAGWHDAELALRLLRLSDVPVLVVPPGVTRLPHRVVLAVDFTPYSIHAGQVALRFAADDALVHLVHVRNVRPLPGVDVREWSHGYEESTRSELARARTELGGDDGHQYETASLTGDPATALTDFATGASADLVVCGAHGRGFVDRLFVGSVAAGLLHRAPCSVLCVPGSALARAAHRRWAQAGMHTVSVPREEWGTVLARLSRHSRGRRCGVEIEHAGLGAQQLADGLPFDGADFDEHGDRVTLRLGVVTRPGRYLAHAIPNARQMDVVADDTGLTHVLRIGDDEGQTLVTFTG